MKNFVFGYARVSTEQQDLDRQLDMLQKYGVDYIYNEKMTGTKRNRPELEKLLERLTEGDTVVVESLSRLGRSTKDLIWLMETFNTKGVNLVSLKESIDTTTSTGKLLFTLMSALAQFERDVLADRTKEGLAAARARGRNGRTLFPMSICCKFSITWRSRGTRALILPCLSAAIHSSGNSWSVTRN